MSVEASAEECGDSDKKSGSVTLGQIIALIAAAAVGGVGMFRVWDVSHYLFWAPEEFAKPFHELGNLWVHGMVLGTASLLAGLCLIIVSLTAIMRILRPDEPRDYDEGRSDGMDSNRVYMLLKEQAGIEARIAELEKPRCDSD